MFEIAERIKRFFIVLVVVIVAVSCLENPAETEDDFTANNLKLTKTILGSSNTIGKYRMITFDLKDGSQLADRQRSR